MLGKSPMNWRQGPDMTIAVHWDVKHQYNGKQYLNSICQNKNASLSVFYRPTVTVNNDFE